MALRIDRTGEQFGFLTLKKYLGRRRWLATCGRGGRFCKGTTRVYFQNLVNPYSRIVSCGCVRKELAAKRQPLAISRITVAGRKRAGAKVWSKRSREKQANVMSKLNRRLFCPDCKITMGRHCPRCHKHRDFGVTLRDLAERGGLYDHINPQQRHEALQRSLRNPRFAEIWRSPQGRSPKRGKMEPRPLTTKEQITEILECRFIYGRTYRQIAKALRRTDSCIIRICRGERHKDAVERWKTAMKERGEMKARYSGPGEDLTVTILERWTRTAGWRKIGNWPWEPIDLTLYGSMVRGLLCVGADNRRRGREAGRDVRRERESLH